jgi:hypothetical protein
MRPDGPEAEEAAVFQCDPSLGWKALALRRARISSERQRALLATVIEHSEAEAACDVERLMATLVDDPHDHFWTGGGLDVGPKGYAAVRVYSRRLSRENQGCRAEPASGGAVTAAPRRVSER